MTQHAGAQVGGRPIVLVVEDEPLLLMTAIDMVEDAGFEAVAAANAADAVRILEGRADIRIVFTDIDMPHGMDGMRLAACIRDRWPPIAIILTSGKLVPRDEDMPKSSVFFSKPYDPDRVAATLHRLAA